MDRLSSSSPPPPPTTTPPDPRSSIHSGSSDGKTPRSKRHSKKKEKRAAEKAAAAAQQEVLRQLTSLQLPHMPRISMDNLNNYINNNKAEPPTLRILVVADIDLASASALAESALAASDQSNSPGDSNNNFQNRNSMGAAGGSEFRSSSGSVGAAGGRKDDEPNLLNRVDLCIACGPFCREEDLRQYYQGRQRRRHFQRTNAYASSMGPMGSGSGGYSHNSGRSHRGRYFSSGVNNAHSHYPPHTSSQSSHNNHHHHNNYGGHNHYHQHPLRRTREETAALEGLMTAALSQLESIVCRVIFVPGRSDPITTITSSPSGNTGGNGFNSSSYYSQLHYTKERRLTPNSRNIHRHWMPLGPGLGCGGLLYLDWQRLQQPPPLEDGDDDEDNDDDSSSQSSLVHDEVDESSATFQGDNPGIHHAPAAPETDADGTSGSAGIPDDLPPMADHSETPSQQYAERAQQYGAEFCKTLERLVELAPPTSAVTDTPTESQITSLLKTTLFQSILVTHFHHLEPDDDEDTMNYNGDTSNNSISANYSSFSAGGPLQLQRDQAYTDEESDDEEESFDPPWPTEHEAFCALPLVQEHVILEIASGLNSSGATVKPMELPKGKVRVVLPGSLRERGEFCLVDVAFMKDPYQPRTNDYRWRVRKTRFQTINEFL